MPRLDDDDQSADATPQRLASLYEAHARAVIVRLRRLCGDPELARDLAQDAFVIAMRRIDQAPDPTPPAAWLHAIAYNLLRDHRRTRRRRGSRLAWLRRRGSKHAALVGEGPSTRASLADRLGEALDRLDDKQRDAFVLRTIEGLSLQEAAQVLDTTVQTVSYRAKRAEQIVRDHFAQEQSR
ncbi:MAG: sigma-70 family RNA polymerase sigma factor [Nannocystaceae bacterium]